MKKGKKKKDKHLLVQYGLFFLVTFAAMVGIVALLAAVGFRGQALVGEYETAFSDAQVMANRLMEHESLPYLLKFWQEHPETMNEVYWKENTDIVPLVGTGEKNIEISPEALDSGNPEQQKYYASMLYSLIVDEVLYMSETEKATLKGPYFLYRIEDGSYIMCIDVIDDDELKCGDKLNIVGKEGKIYSADPGDLTHAMDNGVWIEMDDGNLTDTVMYPVTFNGEVLGVTMIEIRTDFTKRVDFKMANGLINAIVVVAIIIGIILLIKMNRDVILPIIQVNQGVKSYTEKFDTEETIKKMKAVKSRNEIGRLATEIEVMVQKIHEYAEETTSLTVEKTMLESELSLAAGIQASMLPDDFPDPEKEKRFEIFASMTPAKEVGGDLYDFFLIDDDHLALVIADVSGKSIPAALFMMESKTMIKDRALPGKSPAQVLAEVNDGLLEYNKEQLFITTWLMIIELSTGKAWEANAGHNRPLLCHVGEKFEEIDNEHSIALGIYAGAEMGQIEWQLHPGDKIFVYTDGVTEATNAGEELFGSERLLEAVNEVTDRNQKEIILHVKEKVAQFVGDEPPFDDLTILGFTYNGPVKE